MARPAFTLVEILVVIVIIGILTSLALVVGGRVTKGGQRSLTENTIRVLDATLTEYLSEREAKFPTYYVDESATHEVFPIVDGRKAGVPANTPAEPTIAFYLLLASDVPAVQESLKGLDPKLISRGPVQSTDGRTVKDKQGNVVQGLFVKDAWGNPIRFVLPRYHGGYGDFAGAAGNLSTRPPLQFSLHGVATPFMFQRSYRPFANAQIDKGVGDADEGLCTGGRPYFYSAGPDGDPGTREDNVYSVVPQFPLETRDLK